MAQRILVVDDSQALRTVLVAQLRKQGYDVTTAADGMEAGESARQSPPDLIIMDIMMPRMDGFTACRELRADARTKAVPIILLSALGGEEDIIRGIEAGADDYLVKPFKAPELSAKVKMLMRRAGGYSNRPEEDTRESGTVSEPSLRRFRETGQVVAKDFAGFQIIDKLGQGGTGTVYRAIEPVNMSAVALKIVSPFVSQSGSFRERFQRSCEISIRLRHPNIVRSFNAGEYQGVHYLTQELIEGPTLDRVADREGVFSERRTLMLLRQIADALAHIESQGLIHRDVKPENIFELKTESGWHYKLADFGLSRAVKDLSHTSEGHVLGTPHYLAPEQAAGSKDLDTRCDLYSLAATAFRVLTGRPPFEGDSFQALVLAHINQPVPHARDVRRDVSATTDALLARFLSKQPQARAASVAAALPLIDAALAALPAAIK